MFLTFYVVKLACHNSMKLIKGYFLLIQNTDAA